MERVKDASSVSFTCASMQYRYTSFSAPKETWRDRFY